MLIHSRRKGFKGVFKEKNDPMETFKDRFKKKIDRFEATIAFLMKELKLQSKKRLKINKRHNKWLKCLKQEIH